MVHDDDLLSEWTQFSSTHWSGLNEIVNPAARFIGDLVAPVMRPIQRRLPHFAGLDFSPMITLVIIQSIIMIIPVNAVFSGILCTNFKQIL